MALPQLTDEQRKAALKKAVETRQKRAQLKQRLKNGQITFTQAMADPIAAKMRVRALIQAVPKYGKARALKLMEELGINESRRIQGLGKRQKEELLKEFS